MPLPGTREVFAGLPSLGVTEAVMLTGDTEQIAKSVAASVGITMGGAGIGVALETADVALMADLSRLPSAIDLSRAARTIVQQHLWAAFRVVALLMLATLFGLASRDISVLIHEGATVLVVLNALRLLRFVDMADPQLTQRKEGAVANGPQQA